MLFYAQNYFLWQQLSRSWDCINFQRRAVLRAIFCTDVTSQPSACTPCGQNHNNPTELQNSWLNSVLASANITLLIVFLTALQQTWKKMPFLIIAIFRISQLTSVRMPMVSVPLDLFRSNCCGKGVMEHRHVVYFTPPVSRGWIQHVSNGILIGLDPAYSVVVQRRLNFQARWRLKFLYLLYSSSALRSNQIW